MRSLLVLSSLVMVAACSNGSGGGGSPSGKTYDCDAGACQTLANEIVANVPAGRSPNGICNEPPASFETACADYAQCVQQCGQ